MLPAIKRAVGYRVPIIVDGGVRRGTDILKVRCSRLLRGVGQPTGLLGVQSQ